MDNTIWNIWRANQSVQKKWEETLSWISRGTLGKLTWTTHVENVRLTQHSNISRRVSIMVIEWIPCGLDTDIELIFGAEFQWLYPKFIELNDETLFTWLHIFRCLAWKVNQNFVNNLVSVNVKGQ